MEAFCPRLLSKLACCMLPNVGKRRRSNIVRGKFGGTRRRPSGLPPELTQLRGRERRRPRWKHSLSLWGGAVIAGIIAGAVPVLWPGTANRFVSAPAVAADAAAAETNDALITSVAQLAGGVTGAAAGQSDGINAEFGFCHTGGGENCVVDGDTIWLRGEKIRIADIDAPETHDFRCPSEKELGDQATRRLEELLESGTITLQSVDRDTDRYGRKLRIVLVDGESVGETLVSEGLVRRYGSGRQSWC